MGRSVTLTRECICVYLYCKSQRPCRNNARSPTETSTAAVVSNRRKNFLRLAILFVADLIFEWSFSVSCRFSSGLEFMFCGGNETRTCCTTYLLSASFAQQQRRIERNESPPDGETKNFSLLILLHKSGADFQASGVNAFDVFFLFSEISGCFGNVNSLRFG